MFLNHKTNPLVSVPVEVVLPSRSVMYGQLRARVGAIREAKVSSVPHLRPTARVPHFHIERRRRYPVSIAVGLSYLIDCVLSLRLPPVPRAVPPSRRHRCCWPYDRLNRLRNTHLWPVPAGRSIHSLTMSPQQPTHEVDSRKKPKAGLLCRVVSLLASDSFYLRARNTDRILASIGL